MSTEREEALRRALEQIRDEFYKHGAGHRWSAETARNALASTPVEPEPREREWTIHVEGGPAFMANCSRALHHAAAQQTTDGPMYECFVRLANACAKAASEADLADLDLRPEGALNQEVDGGERV